MPLSSELAYNELIDFSSKINFVTGYLNLVKDENKIIEGGKGAWVLGFWRKFYDLHLLGYSTDFKRDIYATIVR